MIRKMATALLCCVVIVSLVGCASLKSGNSFAGLDLTAEGNSNVGHYNAKNWGIYLLWIPIITGNTDRPNKLFGVSLFNDNVNIDAVGEMLASQAAADGADVLEDLGSGLGSFPVFFPPIIFYKSVTMSANAVN